MKHILSEHSKKKRQNKDLKEVNYESIILVPVPEGFSMQVIITSFHGGNKVVP